MDEWDDSYVTEGWAAYDEALSLLETAGYYDGWAIL